MPIPIVYVRIRELPILFEIISIRGSPDAKARTGELVESLLATLPIAVSLTIARATCIIC
jgi:hypothetical protein